jgi:tight adherence protein B
MPGGVTLGALAAFVAGVAAVIGLGLAAIAIHLRAERAHRKRLNRVGRRRSGGRLDMEDARLSLVRTDAHRTPLGALTERLAQFVPLLDTARLKSDIARGGLNLTVGGFAVCSAALAAVLLAALSLATGASPVALAPAALVQGMLAMNLYVKLRGDMMANRFLKQLPEAIDTIIRGIRSGLPVIECIGTAGAESPDPLGGHFRAISERVQLGESLEHALWRVARVVNKPEVDFFAVSIAIQMETGGSLAEALGNLSDVLRKRQQMKLKVKAVSSEAKASAMIIGALPFIMLGLLSAMSPDYVAPLFTDTRGQMLLVGGFSWMGLGAVIMWRMTQFEI